MKPKGKATIAQSRTPRAVCPVCGKVINSVTGASLRESGEGYPPPPKPKPGDATMCAYCCAILVFDAQMMPRLVDKRERERILAENPTARMIWDQWQKKNDPTKKQ